jgi:hypothetical protein
VVELKVEKVAAAANEEEEEEEEEEIFRMAPGHRLPPVPSNFSPSPCCYACLYFVSGTRCLLGSLLCVPVTCMSLKTQECREGTHTHARTQILCVYVTLRSAAVRGSNIRKCISETG